jgi:hypothetical protein
MDSDALRSARQRYKAAYDAYQTCAERNARNLSFGYDPTDQELAAEAQARETLVAARREWLDAMGNDSQQ